MFGLIIQSRPTSFLHYIKVSNRSIVVLNSFDIIFLKTNDSGQIWLDLLVNELWNTRERVVLRKCPKVTKIMPKQKGRSCHIITISNSIVICKCIPPLMNELYFDNQTVHIYIQIFTNNFIIHGSLLIPKQYLLSQFGELCLLSV